MLTYDIMKVEMELKGGIMRKKIVSFLIAFCMILPACFMLIACGKDDDKDNNQESGDNSTVVTTPTNKEIYDDIVDDLDDLFENVTLMISPSYTYTAHTVTDSMRGASKTDGKGLGQISYRIDDNNIELYYPTIGEKAYIIDENMYTYNSSEQIWSFQGFYGDDKVDTNIEAIQEFELADFIEDIGDIAVHFDEDAIYINDNDANTKYVYATLDIASRINALQNNYKANHDKELYKFINALLSDFAQKEVNIYESISNFVATIDNDTTVDDLLNYLSSETGVEVPDIIENINDVLDFMSGKDLFYDIQEKYKNENPDRVLTGTMQLGELSLIAEEFELNEEVRGFKLLSYFNEIDGASITSSDIQEYVDYVLNNTENSLDNLLDYTDMTEEDRELLDTIMNDLEVNTLDFIVELRVDKQTNAFKQINFGVNANARLLDEQGDGFEIEAKVDISMEVSNIGSTEVELPSNIVANDASLNLFVSKAEFEADTYTFSNIGIKLNDFEISKEDTVYATYNSNTQTLTLNLDNIREWCGEWDNLIVLSNGETGSEYLIYFGYLD